ncbi:hypothetical protein AB0O07_22355 [Streptomyces sp. NPDC093085]|uniref:hypothetical protein n=1 Tax=Streptomyces sp. NPDC093085 TaxID=3155068 RepID=UPI0034263B4B
MRRGLVHAIAWLLATGAATTLTWWGVHTVMAGTAYDPPRALPLPVEGAQEVSTASRAPLESSTHRPKETPAHPPSSSAPPAGTESPKSPRSPGSSESSGSDGRSPGAGSGTGATPPANEGNSASTEAGSGGKVAGYTVDGGRVVLELHDDYAELVSATPNAGWQVQAWTEEYWIRVTFTRDGREVSVFCTWHDGPPRVEFDDR